MKNKTIEFIKQNKIIAIVRGVSGDDIAKLAEALVNGGIRCIEVTFNQRDSNHLQITGDAIRTLSEKLGDKVAVGAGTVMTEAQCVAAVESGAKYIISPNFNPAIVKKTLELGVVSIPGALTPSEAAAADECGADFVKLFPAGNLGSSYIKSLCAPLNHISFLAVGGINDGNIVEFLNCGVCGVGIGGNLVDVKLIKEGAFATITTNAKQYTDQL